MENFGILLVALVVGIVIGALLTWVALRRSPAAAPAPDNAAVERLRAAEASARADAERARAQISQTEVRVQEAHADAERARRGAAEAQTAVAQARSETAQHLAQVATLKAKVVAATAERDTALTRAAELAADRDSLTKEFKLLAGQALDEQGKKADATAAQRLQATEQLMAPVRESLERFNARLVEVEKERVTMATELRDQVKSVRVTGDELRRRPHRCPRRCGSRRSGVRGVSCSSSAWQRSPAWSSTATSTCSRRRRRRRTGRSVPT